MTPTPPGIPLLVTWETTRASHSACIPPGDEIRRWRDLGELSTLEAMAMMNDVRRFGRASLMLAGGDPFKRDDLLDLVTHGARIGLRMGLAPSATPLLAHARLRVLREAGLTHLAMGLDAPTAPTHDRLRGVEGSYDRAVGSLRAAREEGLSIQVDTALGREGLSGLDALADRVTELGAELWSVAFLVPVGGEGPNSKADLEAFESAYDRLRALARSAPFRIESTAAPHSRRVVHENRSVFVNHRGEIQPSGCLPLERGNVRQDDLVKVYRTDPVFVALRDPECLQERCGVCEYRGACRAPTAWAWARRGDPLAEAPGCGHLPAGWTPGCEWEGEEAGAVSA
jgi:AdoMet-dependent heme synthase